jgi:hypothetical protein
MLTFVIVDFDESQDRISLNLFTILMQVFFMPY